MTRKPNRIYGFKVVCMIALGLRMMIKEGKGHPSVYFFISMLANSISKEGKKTSSIFFCVSGEILA